MRAVPATTYRGRSGQWAFLLHRVTGFGVFLFLLYPQTTVNAIRPGTAILTLGLLAFSVTWVVIAGIVIALTKGRLSYTSPVPNEAHLPLE